MIQSAVLITCVYWVSYLIIRKRVRQLRIWKVLFLGNMILGLGSIAALQFILYTNEIIKFNWFAVSSISLFLGIIIHHVSICLENTRWRKFYFPKIHGVVSHSLFFVPFGINSTWLGWYFLQNSRTNLDFIFSSVFLVNSVAFGTIGFLVGLGILRLKRFL